MDLDRSFEVGTVRAARIASRVFDFPIPFRPLCVWEQVEEV